MADPVDRPSRESSRGDVDPPQLLRQRGSQSDQDSLQSVHPIKTPPLAFVTATYRRDLEQFLLLRASLQQFAPDIPHWVGVHTEDLPLFVSATPPASNLHFLPTARLLTPHLELVRRRARYFQASKPLRSLRHHFMPMGRFDGYLAQQLVKLELAGSDVADNVLIVDSDTILIRPLTLDIVAAALGGTFARRAVFSETSREWTSSTWTLNAFRLLNVNSTHTNRNYVYIPGLMQRTTVQHLRLWIEKTYQRDWREVMATYTDFSEFTIYGHFASHYDNVEEIPTPGWTHVYHTPLPISDFHVSINDVKHRTNVQFIILQSIMRISERTRRTYMRALRLAYLDN